MESPERLLLPSQRIQQRCEKRDRAACHTHAPHSACSASGSNTFPCGLMNKRRQAHCPVCALVMVLPDCSPAWAKGVS